MSTNWYPAWRYNRDRIARHQSEAQLAAMAAASILAQGDSVTGDAAFSQAADPVPSGPTLRSLLTTSGASYDAAASGALVPVTQAEYNAVVASLQGASVLGTTEVQMTGAAGTNWGPGFAIVNPTQTPVPSGSYVVAFSHIPGFTSTNTYAIYGGDAVQGNYTRIGNSITVASTANVRRWYVVKNPGLLSQTTYMCIYSSTSQVTRGSTINPTYYKSLVGNEASFGPPFLPWNSNTVPPAFQYIHTPTKSW